MFQLAYCVGGSLKNLCHFEMGGGGVWQMLTSLGEGGRSMLTVADRGEGGGKICQNLADVNAPYTPCQVSNIVLQMKNMQHAAKQTISSNLIRVVMSWIYSV